MTAEEYIESVGNTVVNGKAIVKSDFIPKNIAYKAVKMARKEEREKFSKLYSKKSMEIIEESIVKITDDGDSFINEEKAKDAIISSVNEEREKAIQAYKELHCCVDRSMPCEICSEMCYIRKFKELLNK